MEKAIIQKHAKILLAGFLHAWKGVAAAAMFAGSIALLFFVPTEGGYFAVGMFVASLLAFALAGLLFYSCGCDMQKGAFSK